MILSQRHSCGDIHREKSEFRLLMSALACIYRNAALYSCVLT